MKIFTTLQINLGKWVLWNVTRIGSRGVVQAMEELESPPTWALYGN